MEYIFKIGIEGQSKPVAEKALSNLLSIRKSLNSDKDLEDLARLLEKNPAIIETAKQMFGINKKQSGRKLPRLL